ncbi:hypothetical protein HPB48_005292 [Haemaphysalis longicornis]|uniref:Uncharacterized protein n=1 Tax=Haemaphysalis longicornis TaxID=44386 RepID=A0A9J6GGP6_HAELO|nr:hypothetical protein HPB48_005292 [Haemaphysalis longicornis]
MRRSLAGEFDEPCFVRWKHPETRNRRVSSFQEGEGAKTTSVTSRQTREKSNSKALRARRSGGGDGHGGLAKPRWDSTTVPGSDIMTTQPNFLPRPPPSIPLHFRMPGHGQLTLTQPHDEPATDNAFVDRSPSIIVLYLRLPARFPGTRKSTSCASVTDGPVCSPIPEFIKAAQAPRHKSRTYTNSQEMAGDERPQKNVKNSPGWRNAWPRQNCVPGSALRNEELGKGTAAEGLQQRKMRLGRGGGGGQTPDPPCNRTGKGGGLRGCFKAPSPPGGAQFVDLSFPRRFKVVLPRASSTGSTTLASREAAAEHATARKHRKRKGPPARGAGRRPLAPSKEKVPVVLPGKTRQSGRGRAARQRGDAQRRALCKVTKASDVAVHRGRSGGRHLPLICGAGHARWASPPENSEACSQHAFLTDMINSGCCPRGGNMYTSGTIPIWPLYNGRRRRMARDRRDIL